MPAVASGPAVAVIGAGYFAGFHLQGWQAAGARVAALADIDRSRAQALADAHGVEQVHDSVEALVASLRHSPVQLLDLVLPPAAQAAVLPQALRQGLPVICQKPFGASWDEAVHFTRLAADAGVTLVVHENFRFAPWFRECRRLIDSGHFGRLHGVSFRLRPGDGQGPGAYLDRQPYFQRMPRLLIRETAVHFIDSFRYLLGEVIAVTARLRRLNPAIAGEDAGIVHFEFANDVVGLFDGNRLNGHAGSDPRRTMGEMWLEGERGVLRLDGDARLWWQPHGGSEAEHPYDNGGTAAFGGAVGALQRHVLCHLTSATPLENSAAAYLANLRVQEAIYHAHASGRRVALDGFDPTDVH